MVNHILHQLGDRVLCEPDTPDAAAEHISTDPDLTSCPSCARLYEQQQGLRVSLGLTEARRNELVRRAEQAFAEDTHEPLALTPAEVLHLLGHTLDGESGVLAPRAREGHWEGVREPEPQRPALVPPPTPRDGIALKPDNNYHIMYSDLEADARAREGHGHVRPLPGGVRAKCGGPAGPCGVCRREAELVEAGIV